MQAGQVGLKGHLSRQMDCKTKLDALKAFSRDLCASQLLAKLKSDKPVVNYNTLIQLATAETDVAANKHIEAFQEFWNRCKAVFIDGKTVSQDELKQNPDYGSIVYSAKAGINVLLLLEICQECKLYDEFNSIIKHILWIGHLFDPDPAIMQTLKARKAQMDALRETEERLKQSPMASSVAASMAGMTGGVSMTDMVSQMGLLTDPHMAGLMTKMMTGAADEKDFRGMLKIAGGMVEKLKAPLKKKKDREVFHHLSKVLTAVEARMDAKDDSDESDEESDDVPEATPVRAAPPLAIEASIESAPSASAPSASAQATPSEVMAEADSGDESEDEGKTSSTAKKSKRSKRKNRRGRK